MMQSPPVLPTLPPAVLELNDPLVRAIAALLLGNDAPRPRVVVFGPNEVRLRTEAGQLVVLLRQLGSQFAPVGRVLQLLEPTGGDLILVGGRSDLLAEWRERYPELSQTQVRIHQITASASGPLGGTSEEGTGWNGFGEVISQVAGSASVLTKKLRRAQEITAVDQERLLQLIQEDLRWAQSLIRGLDAFRELLQSRKPWITWTLLGTIAAVFLLQQSLGSSSVVWHRMGALDRVQVLHGEWWRLISCTFLHGSWMHFGFNAYVLYALGNLLEKLLGWPRFLLLYVGSAILASLVSTWALGAGISVGASGAVWGLLVCEAGLAWSRRRLLPEAIRTQMRQAAVFNLGLNIVNSFSPGVDWAAHLGGGLAGGALFLSGILTGRLPAFGSDIGGTEVARPTQPESLALRIAGGVAGAILVVGLGTGLLVGKAWELRRAPTLVALQVPELGVRLELPSYTRMGSVERSVSGRWEIALGAPRQDPAAGGLTFHPHLSGAVGGAAPASVDPSLLQTPSGWLVDEAPHATSIGNRPVVQALFRQKGHRPLRWEVYLWVIPEGFMRLDWVCDETVKEACPEAADIAASVQFAPAFAG